MLPLSYNDIMFFHIFDSSVLFTLQHGELIEVSAPLHDCSMGNVLLNFIEAKPSAVHIKMLHWLTLRNGSPAIRDNTQRLWKTIIYEIFETIRKTDQVEFVVWTGNLQQHWIWLTIDLVCSLPHRSFLCNLLYNSGYLLS